MNNKMLKLNKSLFHIETINQAIIDYKDFCSINLNNGNEYYIFNFINTKYNLSLTTKEFCNYLINLETKLYL